MNGLPLVDREFWASLIALAWLVAAVVFLFQTPAGARVPQAEDAADPSPASAPAGSHVAAASESLPRPPQP